jgi:secreted PhoX family phosphatase
MSSTAVSHMTGEIQLHFLMNTRRYFLKTGAALAAGFGGLQLLTNTAGARAVKGYGALRADPKKILDLPKGFSYRVISKAGTRMADGLQVPGGAVGEKSRVESGDHGLGRCVWRK